MVKPNQRTRRQEFIFSRKRSKTHCSASQKGPALTLEADRGFGRLPPKKETCRPDPPKQTTRRFEFFFSKKKQKVLSCFAECHKPPLTREVRGPGFGGMPPSKEFADQYSFPRKRRKKRGSVSLEAFRGKRCMPFIAICETATKVADEE
jgi:hypothetical protein